MKAAFIDRDGVINKEVGYLYKVEEFEYTHKCIEGLSSLMKHGYNLFIVTNQAGIAKGLYTIDDYNNLMDWIISDLDKHGIMFTDIFFCPHHPDGVVKKYSITCSSRKPSPGMFKRAQKLYNIDMKNSIVIGDKITDIQAGMNAGVGKSFLVRSGHFIKENELENCQIVDNLFEVSKVL